ncbi:MAG: alpha-glucuronidase [Pelomonas sp.]|nr:alpha-glucuronidase [Roseateles sp.]
METRQKWFKAVLGLALALPLLASGQPGQPGEDGYDLWLRYRALPAAARAELLAHSRSLVGPTQDSPMLEAAAGEIERGVAQMGGRAPARAQAISSDGALVLATPASLPALASLGLPLAALGPEGYALRSTRLDGHAITLIAANTERGLLYGSFVWLRAVQLGADLAHLDEQSAPKVRWRMLDHWDNLDRTVERGYAGLSIWDWAALPGGPRERYVDYARANASLGINAAVLNNVNTRAEMLTAPWLFKVAALADVLRPYGIRVFVSARFSAPLEIGGLPTADPLDPRVRAWWRAKADEIYRLIPDFGGFLVKANSEGEPGPRDYGRSHMDGANMLADALAPHRGLVIWRAFVYSEKDADDRAKQAYTEFVPGDGKFAANVVVQVKNGPIDFQPREPFHPLFGAMPHTNLGLEFEITKEYLGFSTHLAYLGPLFEEVLRADTHQAPGATVARIVDGAQYGDGRPTLIAGVANIGTDRNWCGSQFDQANWYVFGRLAWDPELSAEAVAREWAARTFGHAPGVVDAIAQIMMGSREAVVDYMTPLGLAHLMGTSHHYGPAPWVAELARPEWNPVYYHRADADGIGFDRGASGSGAVAQYAPYWARRWGDAATTPPELLLWFHHVGWDERPAAFGDGRTVWEELVHRYDAGVAAVVAMRRAWDALAPAIDPRRHAEVASFLAVQEREARWWRDACVAYFQSLNHRALPAGVVAPAATLEQYRAMKFSFAAGRGG